MGPKKAVKVKEKNVKVKAYCVKDHHRSKPTKKKKKGSKKERPRTKQQIEDDEYYKRVVEGSQISTGAPERSSKNKTHVPPKMSGHFDAVRARLASLVGAGSDPLAVKDPLLEIQNQNRKSTLSNVEPVINNIQGLVKKKKK